MLNGKTTISMRFGACVASTVTSPCSAPNDHRRLPPRGSRLQRRAIRLQVASAQAMVDNRVESREIPVTFGAKRLAPLAPRSSREAAACVGPRRVSARISFKPVKRELMRPWALDLAAYSDSASRASASTYRRPRVTHFAFGRTNTSASLGNVSGNEVGRHRSGHRSADADPEYGHSSHRWREGCQAFRGTCYSANEGRAGCR